MHEPPGWLPIAALTPRSESQILYRRFHTSEVRQTPDCFFQSVLQLNPEVSTKYGQWAAMQDVVSRPSLTHPILLMYK